MALAAVVARAHALVVASYAAFAAGDARSADELARAACGLRDDEASRLARSLARLL